MEKDNTAYYKKGKVKYRLQYKTNPIEVEVDAPHLEKLNTSIKLKITKNDGKYHVTGKYDKYGRCSNKRNCA